MAIIDEPGSCARFGPEGLALSSDGRTARSRLGTYYERRPDGSRSLFSAAEGGSARVAELRVWVGVGVAPGTEGYTPNALQWQPGELERLRAEDARRQQQQ